MKFNEPPFVFVRTQDELHAHYAVGATRLRFAFETCSIMQVLHAYTLYRFYGCRALLTANHTTTSKNDVAVSRQLSIINITDLEKDSKIEPQKIFAVHSLEFS